MTTPTLHDARRRPPEALFAERVPEPDEPQTAEENAAYAAWIDSPFGRALYASLAEHIARVAAPSPGARVLCVAEGEGTLARALARRLPRATVVATDVCEDMLERARAGENPPNLTFQQGSVYALGEVEADLVVCAFSFHHFHEPGPALRGLMGAVAPGGALYVVDLRRDAVEAVYHQNLAEQSGADPAMGELVARSFRAAHTRAELSALAAEVAPAAWRHVGAVRLTEECTAGFQGDGLPPASAVRARVQDLWAELLVVAAASPSPI